MIKPEIISPAENVNRMGKIFDAPLVSKGWTWLPLTEIVVFGIMVREINSERNWLARLRTAALSMTIMLGSEWCHNLAHAAAAKMVGHPVDAIRVTWGMPLLVYHDIEDPTVTPRAHIMRALGGPIINTLLLGIAVLPYPFTKPKSSSRFLINTALKMNAFLILGGMLPIPGIDGGAILKWALVEKGKTPSQADRVIRQVDMVASVGLATGAAVAFKKRKRLLGSIFAMFAGSAAAIGTGLLQEKA